MHFSSVFAGEDRPTCSLLVPETKFIMFLVYNQTMYVRWNNVMSSGFKVGNGVRQGGILSPPVVCIMLTNAK